MVWPREINNDIDECSENIKHVPYQLTAGRIRNFLEHNCSINIWSPLNRLRYTATCATIGAASKDVDTLVGMLENGMTIARIIYGSNSPENHVHTINNIKEAIAIYNEKYSRNVCVSIVSDTIGPEIHLGFIIGGSVFLPKGHIIRLTTDTAFLNKGSDKIVFVSYTNIHKVLTYGNRILIDFGAVVLTCMEFQGSNITCAVETEGRICSKAFVNLPGVFVDMPVIGEEDEFALEFAVKQEVQIIMPSFVQEAKNIIDIRARLEKYGEFGKSIIILPKIENLLGIRNVEEILNISDGIVIARGDMGDDIHSSRVFLAQKYLIGLANKMGKPVVVISHLLESLKTCRLPTKAELSDIGNAVLEGIDVLMTSSETGSGMYPVEAMHYLDTMSRTAEPLIHHKRLFKCLSDKIETPTYLTNAIAFAAVSASYMCLAAAIIVLTTSGKTAQLVSKYFPKCPVVAVTRKRRTAHFLNLLKCVVPLLYEKKHLDNWFDDVELRINYGIKYGKQYGFIKTGDPIVILNDSSPGSVITDTMRILYVSDMIETVTIGDDYM